MVLVSVVVDQSRDGDTVAVSAIDDKVPEVGDALWDGHGSCVDNIINIDAVNPHL